MSEATETTFPRRIAEVSNISFNPETGKNSFMCSVIELYQDGTKKVLSFGEQEVEAEGTQAEMTPEEFIAYMGNRHTSEIAEVVYSEKQTQGEPNSGFVPASGETPSTPSSSESAEEVTPPAEDSAE